MRPAELAKRAADMRGGGTCTAARQILHGLKAVQDDAVDLRLSYYIGVPATCSVIIARP
jgi:hypothetical protein